jgi:hypothetical protein
LSRKNSHDISNTIHTQIGIYNSVNA